MTRYRDLLGSLRTAYDGGAERRDRSDKPEWKLAERQAFLDRLRAEGRERLLEVGAGTGQDALFFQEGGLEVVAVDLSPEMVARCRAKGLEAHVADFLHLGVPPASFDAVHAMNCLLHVPSADLPEVLEAIRDVLVPGGLFFLGTYGGESFEGPSPDDWHDPPRFFSFRTDAQMEGFVRACLEIVDFHVVVEGGTEGGMYFQSFTLRRPDAKLLG
jgi:SAM-dependent methyltransferase